MAIDAVAADMSLQAIKGKVTGKQSGRSMLVRSLSGIGETAVMQLNSRRSWTTKARISLQMNKVTQPAQ